MSESKHDLLTRQGFGLTLGALGVVYGDIGTSPLYAIQISLSAQYGVALNPASIFGILSLIFWLLIVIVSVKYGLFIMRADNRGEGGVLSLLALSQRTKNIPTGGRWLIGMIAVFGASLFFSDGMITPAISVLSAVEGIGLVEPALKPFVIPLTLVILTGLFLSQRRGTAQMGRIFGPVMCLWFAVLGVLGLQSILATPEILAALDPRYGIDFLLANPERGFLLLGAVGLAVTGAEAIYADMGHFGLGPIRLAWFAYALPGLLLNYFGQGALVLRNPSAAENPFYLLAPEWALIPLVALATLSTVIASQAMISGAFSVGRQAVQLRLLPRMTIRHTSETEIGQIYVPFINWMLFAAVVALVLGFGSSAALAQAYGIAVTGTFICSGILVLVIAYKRWHWPLWLVLLLGTLFLGVDLALFLSMATKIIHGGWFPLLIALTAFTLMTTWSRGRTYLDRRVQEVSLPLDVFLENIISGDVIRVPGTAVFLTGNRNIVPSALLHNLKHNKVLHERVVFLTISSREIPRVPLDERLSIQSLADNVFRVSGSYGFQETPNVPELLDLCTSSGLVFDMMDTSFFLSRETLIPSPETREMAFWREKIYVGMAKNSLSAAHYFGLPMNRVIELGAQMKL